MPDRFKPRPRPEDEEPSTFEGNSRKLDRLADDVTDMRVAMTSVAADVRTLAQRLERHDADHLQGQVERATVAADVERRLRTLERRNYGIPTLASILALAGFALALWTAWGHH
jgi:hypothetical protein